MLLRPLGNLLSKSPGIEVENVLAADLLLAPARYTDEASQAAFQSRLVERLEALPGAVSAAAVMPLPLSMNGWQTSYFAEGKPHPAHGEEPLTEIARVSAGYRVTLGIPLVRSRYFTQADREGSVPVAIVDETFTELEWPGEDPLGKRVRLGGHDGENPWLEVVGVVGHGHRSASRQVRPLRTRVNIADPSPRPPPRPEVSPGSARCLDQGARPSGSC